ncbi:MAG: hypothetical protein ACK42I_07395, partial [Thermomicrobium sp.]
MSPAARTLRIQMQLVRLAAAYLPLGIANWLLETGARHVTLPPDIKREEIRRESLRGVWLVPEITGTADAGGGVTRSIARHTATRSNPPDQSAAFG